MSMEKYLERKFVEWVDSVGGLAMKGPAALYKGVPDRIAILPYGGTVWVEFKGGTEYGLTAMQKCFKDMLVKSDRTRYYVVDNKDDLASVIAICKCLINHGKHIEHTECKIITANLEFYKNGLEPTPEALTSNDESI